MDSNQKRAVFLYDRTGIMAKPWLDAGYECWLFDGQHQSGIHRDGNLVKVGVWFDPGKIIEHAKMILSAVKSACFVFGFPECTDLTVAGAKHFKKKFSENPLFQEYAIALCDLVRVVGNLFSCPYGFENPKWNVLSTKYRKFDFSFDPCDFGGYLPIDDAHPLYPEVYPGRDAYNKGTAIWIGNGFKIPRTKRIEPEFKENPGWKKCGGKSLKTKNIRSATPRGFARATFEANKIR